MKMLKTLGLTLAVAGLMATTAQAASITGQITLNGGGTISGGSSTVGTFTTLTLGSAGTVAFGGGTGSYSGIPAGTAATFTTNPLLVGAPGSTGALAGASPFWTLPVGGFSFNLLSISSNVYNAASPETRVLNGSGMLMGTGFDPTPAVWQLSTSGSDTTLNIGTTTLSIPDGGSAIALLGMGLVVLAAARRKLQA